MNNVITDNAAAIGALCKRHHVKSLYAFGSVTTEAFNGSSDVDFLYEPDYSGFDFTGDVAAFPFDPFSEFFDLKFALEALLKRSVDLVPLKSFENPYFNQSVQASRQLVFRHEGFA